MVNLIAGEEVVPELVQQDFTAANVVARIQEILPDCAARDRMLEGLTRVKALLRPPETNVAGSVTLSPADRAAEIVLDMVH